MSLALKTKSLFTIFLLTFFSQFSQAQQWGDYTLYSVMNATASYLLDTNGNVAKTWTHASSAKSGYSCYLMPGGYLWRGVARTGNSFTGGPITGEVQKVDWAGNVVWDFVYSTTDYCTHHDICPLPNGNVLLIAYERKVAGAAVAAGSTFAGEVWSEKLVEIKPTGATTGDVVWEWKFWDHLVQDKDSTKPNYQKSIVNHPELLNVNYKVTKDWIHMNGVDYNPILDQIAISSHYLNEWYIIDHSTTTAEAATHSGGNANKGGDFLYRWGNPAAYNATGTQVLKVTHDAHWIPENAPNAGRLVGFNNQGVSTTKSSVDQIVTPLNGYNYDLTLGSAYEPSTYTRHACNGYTSNAGSSDQLPNGNMLVCIALSGYIYELDPNGNSIWNKTVTGSAQQAHRYDKCFTDNEPPAIPTISASSNVLSSTSATTYQWYFNGQKISGANSKNYTATQNGIYLVRITDAKGCIYQYSKAYKYSSGISTFNISSTKDTDSICPGNNYSISINSSGENGVTTYAWSSTPSGFSAFTRNITVGPTISTNYKLVATNNGIKDSLTFLLKVLPKPNKPIITQITDTLKSSLGSVYKWYNDTILISGAINQKYTPTKSGVYRAKITDGNGCSSDFSSPYSFFLSDIKRTPFGSFQLYPNPSHGSFSILNPNQYKNVKVQVRDVFGKTVLETNDLNQVNMLPFKSGVYFITILVDQYHSGSLKLNLIK